MDVMEFFASGKAQGTMSQMSKAVGQMSNAVGSLAGSVVDNMNQKKQKENAHKQADYCKQKSNPRLAEAVDNTAKCCRDVQKRTEKRHYRQQFTGIFTVKDKLADFCTKIQKERTCQDAKQQRIAHGKR